MEFGGIKPEYKLLIGAICLCVIFGTVFVVYNSGQLKVEAPECNYENEKSEGKQILVTTDLLYNSIYEGEITYLSITLDNIESTNKEEKQSVAINIYADGNIALEGNRIYIGDLKEGQSITKSVRLTGLVHSSEEKSETYEIKVEVEGYKKDFSKFSEISTAFLMITKPK